MRKNLAENEGVRATFTGCFVRFGIKDGWHGTDSTVLLKDIKNAEGRVLTDHLWFNLTKAFEVLDLRVNDIIQFDARVAAYEKGYKGRRDDIYCPVSLDYKLSHPTKVKLVERSVSAKTDTTTYRVSMDEMTEHIKYFGGKPESVARKHNFVLNNNMYLAPNKAAHRLFNSKLVSKRAAIRAEEAEAERKAVYENKIKNGVATWRMDGGKWFVLISGDELSCDTEVMVERRDGSTSIVRIIGIERSTEEGTLYRIQNISKGKPA